MTPPSSSYDSRDRARSGWPAWGEPRASTQLQARGGSHRGEESGVGQWAPVSVGS